MLLYPKITPEYDEADIPEYLRPFIPVDGKVYSTDLNNKRILLDVGSKEWFAELCRRRESANETNSVKSIHSAFLTRNLENVLN
ncbi:hypothetical protein RhiirA4_402562 [Rhizophagus irregularis]|uniref:Uncharacterized protein n=1 Tax=Rhizophagus irregularis TaxID=588596 RepID=A0A2I1GIS6_9GLOM|nr:hypothetical protein RhiirA4_402562 [Rhizophagus irregularis]